MTNLTKSLLSTGLLCTCLLTINTVVYADIPASTSSAAAANRVWKVDSIAKTKETVKAYSASLSKQAAVNYDGLFKISTLNKTQKAQFEKYTSTYKTAINVAKESMNFYLADLDDLASTDLYTNDEKGKQAEDIRSRASADYREAVNETQTYLRNCSYAMPPLTYQKFLKAFDTNFFLGQIDMAQYTKMK